MFPSPFNATFCVDAVSALWTGTGDACSFIKVSGPSQLNSTNNEVIQFGKENVNYSDKSSLENLHLLQQHQEDTDESHGPISDVGRWLSYCIYLVGTEKCHHELVRLSLKHDWM